jgi:hypothetical protein
LQLVEEKAFSAETEKASGSLRYCEHGLEVASPFGSLLHPGFDLCLNFGLI